MVDHPLELDFEELTKRDVVERVITLCCVSNEVGGAYIGTRRWLGVPLAAAARGGRRRTHGADQLALAPRPTAGRAGSRPRSRSTGATP